MVKHVDETASPDYFLAPKPQNIQLTVTEEERKQKIFIFKLLKEGEFWLKLFKVINHLPK